MKYAIITITLIMLSSATLAQGVPQAKDAADLQSIGLDEQALISALHHNDVNLTTLMREVSTLRAENKRLTDELAKAKPQDQPEMITMTAAQLRAAAPDCADERDSVRLTERTTS